MTGTIVNHTLQKEDSNAHRISKGAYLKITQPPF
jgi:hypothetical protein